MASVLKRGAKWYARYKDQRNKWRLVVGYADKRETEKLAQRLEDESHKIAIGDVDPQAVARRIERSKAATDHVTMFEAHMKSKGRHANHVQYTVKDIRRCLEHAGVTTAAALTLPLVDTWRSFCMTTGYPKSAHGDTPTPDSPKTANRRVASVRAWLRYLNGVGAIDRNPIERIEMLNTKGHETRHRRALSMEEADKLLEKCPDPHRRELYRFALLTGLRRSECVSMTPASFDFQNKTITVNAIHSKRKSDHQVLAMHSQLVESLKAICASKKADEPVFQVPNRTDVVGILHGDCKVAGVDTTDVDFHALRHTFCSLLAAEGIRPEVLMKLARHRDIATTMRYYVHFKPDDERAALERITPRTRPTCPPQTVSSE